MKQQFVKEFTLKAKPTQRETRILKDSRDTFEELSNIYNPDTATIYETAYVLYLNQNNRVKGFLKLGDGGMTNVIVDPRLVMMGAIGSSATAIVLSHNHPSGNPKPSQDDRLVTKKIAAACRLLDIIFVDHIIMAGNNYYSFRDNGELMD